MNILVIATIGLVVNLLGIRPYITAYGINYESLLAICLIWGFAGSFISLFTSKFMVKTLYRMREIKPSDSDLGYVAQMVHLFAKRSGITKMPEVYIYDSMEVNAFATGPSRNNSLVAVSAGLLHHMDRDEVEGVIAHEVSHIANGDMVTMALAQGVLNAFVMFLSRVVAFALSQAFRKDDDEGPAPIGLMHTFTVMILDVLFGILAMPLLMWFSRFREYRADAGAAKLAGAPKMIAALERLKRNSNLIEDTKNNVTAFKISGRSSWMELFASHPSLDKRIQALKTN